MKNKNKTVKCIISIIISLLIIGGIYYFYLPPVNIFAEDFWGFLVISSFIVSVPLALVLSSETTWFPGYGGEKRVKENKQIKLKMGKKTVKIIVIAAALPIAVLILGGIFSSAFFNAKAYSDIITVETGVFKDDMPQTDSVTNIALMDSASATVLGNRTLGNLSDMVSQYELSDNYTQINYKGSPQKVSNLEYADFFRWLNNKDRGIPGYVMVDPVNNTAE